MLHRVRMSDATKQQLDEIFDYYDSDKSGVISMDNLVKAQGKQLAEKNLPAYDLNKDGKISKEEWYEVFSTLTAEEIANLHQNMGDRNLLSEKYVSPIYSIAVVAHLALICMTKMRE